MAGGSPTARPREGSHPSTGNFKFETSADIPPWYSHGQDISGSESSRVRALQINGPVGQLEASRGALLGAGGQTKAGSTQEEASGGDHDLRIPGMIHEGQTDRAGPSQVMCPMGFPLIQILHLPGWSLTQ